MWHLLKKKKKKKKDKTNSEMTQILKLVDKGFKVGMITMLYEIDTIFQ